jgi:hypothetical protein
MGYVPNRTKMSENKIILRTKVLLAKKLLGIVKTSFIKNALLCDYKGKPLGVREKNGMGAG